MLTTYFKRKTTRANYYASPTGSYQDEFTDWLARCGFHEEVICQYLPGIVHFGIWGEKTYGNLTSLPADALSHFRDYLVKHGRLYYSKGQHSVHWRGVQHFVEFLRLQNKIAFAQALPQAAQPELLQLFESWMLMHRSVMLSTLGNYQQHIAALLSTLGEYPEQYNAKELHAFILASAKDRSHAFIKKRVTAIRMFLRFLIATGHCKPGLDAAIPHIAEWPLARLPRYISSEELERVLACCDDTVPIGMRDKAILLLLVRLGLRASEVADLKLPDIDWSNGTFRIIGKSRREAKLPLPQDVGDALLKYLNTARQPVEMNRIFLTAIAPWMPITRYVVKHVAAKAIRRAGVNAPSFGAHVLRHSAATAMLRQGASLQAIGEVLRHRSIETTAHYAKTDLSLLQQVTRAWPGEASCY